MVYTYFSIVKQERNAPLNLPAVLLHVLERKEDSTESDEESHRGESNSFERKTYILKTIFFFLPATYPLGWFYVT